MAKKKQDMNADQLAKELARVQKEVTGLDDSISTGNKLQSSNSSAEFDQEFPGELSTKLNSAKKVMELLAKMRPEMPARIRDTVVDHDTSNSALELGTKDQNSIDLELLNQNEIPDSIGRFQIESLLGQGGFGLVFKAQDPKLNRLIALKVPNFDSLIKSDSQARFKQEGRVVASLSHPNIVPVYEVGNDGPISFIASEYVAGTDLASWVNENGCLGPREAAQVVAVISDAIQHAHSRQVIHRDLKPANVLLKVSQNSTGLDPSAVRVADFGLAKVLSEQDSNLTRTGSIMGTPAYSAPEQLESKGSDVPNNETVDIYSMGAILYFLLTGEPPFKADSVLEMLRNVQTQTPVAPRKIRANIPADLSAICMKAMEKLPTDRYPNAHEMGNDLRRFLADETVVARPVPAMQRAFKWCRRNPTVAGLLAMTTTAILGGLFASLWYANNARIAVTEWKNAEADARTEALTAKETYSFMIDLFKSADASNTKNNKKIKGKDLTVEVLLKQGTQNIKDRLHDEPEVRAELMTAIGQVCVQLGMYEDAESLLREALQINTTQIDATETEIAESHFNLGRCYRYLDRHAEATEHLENAESVLAKHLTTHQSKYANCLNELGMVALDSDLKKACEYFLQSRKWVDQENPDSLDSLWSLDSNIAALSFKLGEYEQARDAFRNLLDIGEKKHGQDHLRLTGVIGNLAFVEKKLKHFESAIKLQERGLAIVRKHLGPENSKLIPDLINLVQTLQQMGDLERAMEEGDLLVQIAEKILPEGHGLIADAFKTHAKTCLLTRQYEVARKLCLQNISMLRANQTLRGNEKRLRALLTLVRVERGEKQYSAARKYVDTILADDGIDDLDGTKLEVKFEQLYLLAELFVLDGDDKPKFEEVEALYQFLLEFAPKTSISKNLLAFKQAKYFAILAISDSGELKLALNKLEEAIQNGFAEFSQLDDDDFDSIRDSVEFKTLVEK